MAQKTRRELETELTELNNKLDRYEVAHAKGGERERDQLTKIGKLKDVARFYRAQRDRVDAYLSAVMDMIERHPLGDIEKETVPVSELRDVIMSAERAPVISNGQRPRVQEPFIVARHEDGRGYSQYRDQEPAENWEDF